MVSTAAAQTAPVAARVCVWMTAGSARAGEARDRGNAVRLGRRGNAASNKGAEAKACKDGILIFVSRGESKAESQRVIGASFLKARLAARSEE